MIRAVLFDFDGTLADSFAAITASVNHVRGLHDLPAKTEADVRGLVGLGLDNLLDELLPGVPIHQAIDEYRDHHKHAMLTQTTLLPGVAETLRTLSGRGLPMAVCSNKRAEFTRQLVMHLGLSAYFAAVLGPDDVGDRAKPDPAMLVEAARRLGVTPAEAVYVGDMTVDVEAARAGGMPVWIIPSGAGRDDPAAAGPDKVLSRFDDIAELPQSSEATRPTTN
jgi:2-phosphoglycolate phosphatase